MSSVDTISEYELVLMLDPESPEEQREQIAAAARGRIESAGELRHGESWGMRKLAYEIRQRTEADYRFLRFRGEPALLDDLDHSLKIADGVLRFRLFEVDPRSPIAAPPPPVQAMRSREGRPRRSGDGRGRRRERDAEREPAEEPPSEGDGAPSEEAGAAAPAAEAAEQPAETPETTEDQTSG